MSRTPALFTKISIPPNLSTVAFIRFLQSSSFEMSVKTVSTLPPSALILDATSSRAACRRALITTFAPLFAKSIAVAAPTPELPPVITAVFPFKLYINPPFAYCICKNNCIICTCLNQVFKVEKHLRKFILQYAVYG